MKIIGAAGKIGDPARFVEHANSVFKDRGLQAQVADSRFVIDETHVTMAFEQARRRTESGGAIARSLAMEFLLYLGGTHQINVAIDRMGVKPDTEHLLVIVMDGGDELDAGGLLSELGLTAEEPVYAPDLGAVLATFGIPDTLADGSNPELVKKAVLEAVSLVNLEK